MFDQERRGPAVARNEMIKDVKTPWVSMLDDDDVILPNYVPALEREIAANPNAGVIFFKEYFPTGVVIPALPVMVFGNVGISFSVKTELARKHPFKTEEYEDFHFLQRLQEAGVEIYFSKYLTYLARDCGF